MKITFRDLTIFMFGMITAFTLTLIVHNASLSQQQIADGIEIGVLAMVVLLISSLFLGIGINLYRSMKKEVTSK